MDDERQPVSGIIPSLHQATLQGDLEGVRRAIDAGADINALDDSGRTALTCALAGEDWSMNEVSSNVSFMSHARLDILREVLRHPSISLFTMNAPQSPLNGVTPLGFAAWLNSASAVSVLLKDSKQGVTVDGMDKNRATPLMYAARDGNLDVVGKLLSYGARPDSRDINFRTPIQFSLSHPKGLWLCEAVLRLHRWKELKNRRLVLATPHAAEKLCDMIAASLPSFDPLIPPSSTSLSHQLTTSSMNTLIGAIRTSDVTALHDHLFRPRLQPRQQQPISPIPSPVPLLLNRPDYSGWSTIHHCASVAHPSVAILDALYLAGAEVSLFTTREEYTPLHILALCGDSRSGSTSQEAARALYLFAVHLILDLHAPLLAKDKEDNTCLHLAAERGHSIDVLIAFLDCDFTGRGRELCNSKGLTAFQVARPEFRGAFGAEVGKLRSMLGPVIKLRPSITSESSLRWSGSFKRSETPSFDPDFDMLASTQHLLSCLRFTSGFHHGPSSKLAIALRDIQQIGDRILTYFRTKTEAVKAELDSTKVGLRQTAGLLDLVTRGLDERLGDAVVWQGTSALKHGSHDSTSSSEHQRDSNRWTMVEAPDFEYDESVNTPAAAHHAERRSRLFVPWPEWFDTSGMNPNGSTHKYGVARTVDSHGELTASTFEKWGMGPGQPGRWKDPSAKSGTAKLKSWLKRKMKPGHPVHLDILRRIDEEGCPTGKEFRDVQAADSPASRTDLYGGPLPSASSNICDTRSERVLRATPVLPAARRDLDMIAQRLSEADRYLKTATQSISRVERIIQRAIKRRTIPQESPRRSPPVSNEHIFTTSSHSTSSRCSAYSSSSAKARINYTPSMFTAASSNISLTSTLVDSDDEDTKALQRLVLRKIEARLGGALAEVGRVNAWLRAIREVLRGAKRRAYL